MEPPCTLHSFFAKFAAIVHRCRCTIATINKDFLILDLIPPNLVFSHNALLAGLASHSHHIGMKGSCLLHNFNKNLEMN